ncbi:unnamed protein product [Periconia digitata]|uniref:J domain-containing protein n=1 Tax=Periconia digitata TaxID=1303443 RepID=A0A9W4UPA8_9PLEO|nr:unnamed protein product [Periconia digitata]
MPPPTQSALAFFPISSRLCHASPTFKYTTSCRYPPFSHTWAPLSTRSFAQHAHPPSSPPDHAELSWPAPVHPNTTPTPYQILHCSPNDAYSKHRFYSLVKLYHPDRSVSTSPVASLPHAVRVERYRLLVAAHAILSDDSKRKAYDAYGHGWQGHHQTHPHNQTYAWHPDYREWPPGHDPHQNATWEDWERWHHRNDPSHQPSPRDAFMTNFAFVILVFSIVSLGGIMQGTRASMLTSSAMEHHDKIHKEASMELARSKRATVSGDRDERIQTFLAHRQAVIGGEDAYQRMLPVSEPCNPDTVRKQ